jgi:uncharacterized protein (TIGR02147 family)
VLQGKRNLSPHLVLKFASVFKLSKRETAFFELLVAYNQAKTHEEKKHHFDKIARQRRSRSALVRPDQFAFYDQWYHSAIRELLAIHPFRGDHSALAKALSPAITAVEARKSLELLERLDLIQRGEDGAYRPTETTITTGEKWKSLAIHHFQHQTLDLAKRALDQIPREKRDISTITLSCSLDTFSSIKEKIQALRHEIANMAARDETAEGVFQCNFQLFPFAWPQRAAGSKAKEKKEE